MEAIESRVCQLADTLRRRLSSLPRITVHDAGNRKCAIVTFSREGSGSQEIEQILRRRHINVSVSSPRSTLIDATRRGLPDMVRASLHYYNTEQEIDQLIEVLEELS